MDLKQHTYHIWEIYLNGKVEDDIQLQDFLVENCTIIGTGKHEFYQNIHMILKDFDQKLHDEDPLTFEIQKYHASQMDVSEDVSIVYGFLDVAWKCADTNLMIEMNTRFSVVYKKVEDHYKIVHIHQSVPYLDQMNAEYYPKTLTGEIEQLQRQLDELTTQMRKDPLTGLMNVHALKEVYESIMYKDVWCLIIDLKDFHTINESYGYIIGDTVLKQVAQALTAVIRSKDIVCRLERDVFIVICFGLSQEEQLKVLMNRIQKTIQKIKTIHKENIPVAIGATSIQQEKSLEMVLCEAFETLDIAKSNSSEQYQYIHKR